MQNSRSRYLASRKQQVKSVKDRRNPVCDDNIRISVVHFNAESYAKRTYSFIQ